MIPLSKKGSLFLVLVTSLVACTVPLATQEGRATPSPTNTGAVYAPTVTPLAATQTAQHVASEIDSYLGNLAIGYHTFGVRARLIDWPIAYSVCTTVEDLYLWDQALYTEQLVSKELLNAMFTAYVSAPSYDGMYGYGWFIGQKLGRRVMGHAGLIAGSGFRTLIERYPNDKVATIVLSNQENSDVAAIATTIDQSVFADK